MTKGPPPAAAEPSNKSGSSPSPTYNPYATTIGSVQPPPPPPQPSTSQWANGTNTTTSTTRPAPSYGYGSWSSMSWAGYPTTATTSYGAGSSTSGHFNPHLNYQSYYQPAPHSQTPYYPSYTQISRSSVVTPKQEERDVTVPAKRKKPPTPEPEPAPPSLESYRHWDGVLKDFLKEAGMLEALKGFEKDMLILSSDWEEEQIPKALQNLVRRLSGVDEYPKDESETATTVSVDDDPRIPLDERKLTYAKFADGEVPRTPTSINKSISQLLAKNRAKINASNRSEFLCSMSERRRGVQEAVAAASEDTTPVALDPSALGSCARTDAKPINRDEQMKYDIAKNNEGPLSRTIKSGGGEVNLLGAAQTTKDNLTPEELLQKVQDDENVTPARYPALDERLRNVEAHFAVRYVPSPPRTLLSRLKMLEDHIIKLEREYPPWAALHFNQPNRGWPPPPRSTPIIVPPNLRSKDHPNPVPKVEDKPSLSRSVSFAAEVSESAGGNSDPSTSKASGGQKARNLKSSLHRAVMEKLQVQQAMNEMGNGS